MNVSKRSFIALTTMSACALAAIAGSFALNLMRDTSVASSSISSAFPSAPATIAPARIETPTPTSTPSATNKPQSSQPGADYSLDPNCVSSGGASSRPARFQVASLGVNSRIWSMGVDRNGNAGSTPLSRLFDTAWYNGSAMPGSTRGNVVMNIHSYIGGRALGNQLKNGLQPGTIIRIVSSDGKVACYRYRERIMFYASDTKHLGDYINNSGRPQLAIMTCWDQQKGGADYDSRIIFYADYIP